MNKSIKTVIRT